MSKENLNNEEALDKLKEIVNQTDVGMLATYQQNSEYIHAVPMSRQEVDDEGNIWFLFSSESDTFKHLQQSDKISLLFSNVGDYSFLSINGVGEVSANREKIDKYWSKMVEGWFDRGKEDPRIRVLKVKPSEAHYWDTKSNKLVTFFKVAARALTGSDVEIGKQGDLNL